MSNWKMGILIVTTVVILSVVNGLDWFTVLGVGAGMALVGTALTQRGEGGGTNGDS